MATAATARRLLTVEQAADALSVREKTIRAWIWRRQIDYTKVGRSVRIPTAAVDRIIERGTVPALER